MKKNIFIAVLGMGALAVAHGQGSIVFQNYANPATQTTGVTYGNGPDVGLGVGTEITITLLYGASTDTSVTQMTALSYSDTSGDTSPVSAGNGKNVGPGLINGSGAGLFNGGTVIIPAAFGQGAGGTYAIAIEGSGLLSSSLYTGYSSIAVVTTATGLTLPPALPTALDAFTISTASVPEPTTLALAGLGGLASLVALRRKKA